ncbi:MAG TPA: isoprenylcysteine carboxylmethyltransferase family protein [Methanotrichaceae archaeon]|nr:isoprenylcysteine carboxylmethyltransferase family protein [Methanotrichaceae archaeon]
MSPQESALVLVIYLACFAALHSLMASLPFKRRVQKILGDRTGPWYPVIFSLSALVMVLPLVYLVYLFPGKILYVVPSPWRWAMVACQVLAGIVSMRAFIDAPHRFRVPLQLKEPNSSEAELLKLRGIYCWIRDPFLLSGFLIIWLTPFMTTNLLILYVMATVYLYLGSLHWEKRLLAQFGDEFREYQIRVPRMIPKRGRSCPPAR